ncbi:MAG: zinc ABC transporter substrate-binding protein [Deltaproteobacteria bacterium]|nr:zinc ABC transporter substrate-binding protein [Deltaproteobacteria bacterium]
MKRIGKHLSGVACLVIVALSVLPVEAAVTRAFVSIAPQKYFVQKIGGDLVSVSVLVPASADPHTYEPKPKQMAELSKSAVYFAVGIDFENAWLKKIAATNPKMRIVRTDNGIAKIAITVQHPDKESLHGHAKAGHRHHAGSLDPHVWLSPALVKIQAEHILSALTAVDPKNQLRYKANYAVFVGELDALDAELKALFAGRKGEQFMVFHPSWGYFAEAYGLKQIPIEIEGKDPKPAQLQMLIRHARERGIRVVFVQPQFSAKNAEMVSREIGGQVVYVDPMAENWAGNLREVARKFRTVLR